MWIQLVTMWCRRSVCWRPISSLEDTNRRCSDSPSSLASSLEMERSRSQTVHQLSIIILGADQSFIFLFVFQLFVNDAQINSSNILSGNGVIHGLSAVLHINRNRCDETRFQKVMVRSWQNHTQNGITTPIHLQTEPRWPIYRQNLSTDRTTLTHLQNRCG